MKKCLIVAAVALLLLGMAACTAAAAEPDLSQNSSTVPMPESTWQSRICTSPYCDDRDCDGLYCDDRIGINRHGNVWDCNGQYCDQKCGD